MHILRCRGWRASIWALATIWETQTEFLPSDIGLTWLLSIFEEWTGRWKKFSASPPVCLYLYAPRQLQFKNQIWKLSTNKKQIYMHIHVLNRVIFLNETAVLVVCWLPQWVPELDVLPFPCSGGWLNSSTLSLYKLLGNLHSYHERWGHLTFMVKRKHNLCIYSASVLFLLAFGTKQVQSVTFPVMNTNTNPSMLFFLGEHLMLIYMLLEMKA